MWGWAQKHFINHAALLPCRQSACQQPRVHSSHLLPLHWRQGDESGFQTFFVCILPSPPGGVVLTLHLPPCSLSSASPSSLRSSCPLPTLYQQQEMKLVDTEDFIKANICILNRIVKKIGLLKPRHQMNFRKQVGRCGKEYVSKSTQLAMNADNKNVDLCHAYWVGMGGLIQGVIPSNLWLLSSGGNPTPGTGFVGHDGSIRPPQSTKLQIQN